MHTREIRNIYNGKDEFKKELARLEKTNISVVNKATITEYLHHEFAKPVSESRAAKVGGLLRRLAILFAKDFQECTKKYIERVLSCINTNRSLKCNTKIDYRKTPKSFFKYLYSDDLSKIHELVGWFNAVGFVSAFVFDWFYALVFFAFFLLCLMFLHLVLQPEFHLFYQFVVEMIL